MIVIFALRMVCPPELSSSAHDSRPAGGSKGSGTAPGGLARRRHPSMMFIGRVSVQRYLAGTQFVLFTRGTVGSPTSKL